MIHLKDIDDVRLMCDFMNELKEIERLAQAETGKPLPRTDNEWFNDYQRYKWESFSLKEEEMLWTGTQMEKAEELPRDTIREYHEQASQKEPEDMNRLFVYDFDDLTFESDEASQWARLRFRNEGDKWICEIAQTDV